MSRRARVYFRRRLVAIAAMVFATLVMVAPTPPLGWAGTPGLFRNNAVGGISIDAAGVVREADVGARKMLLEELKEEVLAAPAEMNRPVGLRMVSLQGIEAAIRDAVSSNFGKLPEEIEFLAGLQRVEYVLLFPEQNDIVLAGPGEGWRIDEHANVVGASTGRPVLLLDDLLVAFRSVHDAGKGHGISCSIDPTEEGRTQFQRYMGSLRTMNDFHRATAERAMGPQRITISGVPTESHFARVMVAADYRMKRYAMNLEKPPINGLPSFLDLMRSKKGRLTNAMPRWWLACNYEPLARSEDGLAWQLRGPGVQALTEDDFVSKDGKVTSAGRANPIAQQWAEIMTDKYDELSQKDSVFGELRNLMDLCVVAALIEKEDMVNAMGLRLPLLTGQDGGLPVDQWNTPKTVATQCSLMKMGREYVITASGGVEINSWRVASSSEPSQQVGQTRAKAHAADKNAWWWN